MILRIYLNMYENEVFINRRRGIKMEIKSEFTVALLNGIKNREQYDSVEDVLTMLIREHMDSLVDDCTTMINDTTTKLFEQNVEQYVTQGTDK